MSKNKQNLSIKCDSCKHCEVCKYKAEFETLVKKINEIFYEKSEPSPFDVEATCKHFSEPSAPYWPSGVKGIGEIWPNTTKGNDPCENCDWYKSLLTRTTPYVGDSPCEWCVHNKWKVNYCTTTSNDVTATSSDKLFDEKEIRGL